ncbi:phosphorothioated DNA-binding restriction endonuclease [Sulfuritalea sp.]|uniref:phosphorothioated DNA-binding restriction endonuclease n=1 Tax=Sulfuritalea sp. TaxID=2480090 RepID=UPI001ACB6C58|nr:HNH endonuclease [Sulfuritalea sp.]MBN8476287.1 HNH endonuclease [Sulfuritalea sp.]
MTRDEILRTFDRMRVWQRGDQRAVHKPLLVLFALARVGAGDTATIDWNEAEPRLKSLLDEFGPDGSGNSRHHPFWHLQTDGLWRLEGPPDILSRPPSATPTLGELRSNHVRGGFPPALRADLLRDPQLVATIAQRIVDAHFPESIRPDVLAAVGLPTHLTEATSTPEQIRRRDPAFREKVLLAYQYRCSVCGHNLRLGHQPIGLEAAHIKWFQANGPDVVPNGIALCSLHHKVFDLGAFTILPRSYQMVFSQHLNGSDESAEKILAYHGASLILPQSSDYMPQPEFLDWHRKQVFKSPERSLR